MINSSSMRSRARRASAGFIPVLTQLASQNLRCIAVISVFLAAIFIASCGDEGDITEDTTGMTDVLQPTTTTPETQIPAPPEDPVVIEEPLKNRKPLIKMTFSLSSPKDVSASMIPSKKVETAVEEPKASYQDDIQPILAERCAVPGCHVVGHFTGLDLSEYDTFKKGGNGGPVFAAGDGNGSLVVKRIDGGGMPPGGPPLDGDQIQLFIDWIDEGGENN